jgi:heme A synthase
MMKNPAQYVFCAVLALVLPSCSGAQVGSNQTAPALNDYMLITEAVFRHQFEHNASGRQKNATVF